MNSAGFTEDDQARIAEEVLGRVGAKRTGLGFSGGGGAPAPSTKSAASTSSSAWFEQHAESSAGRDEYAGKGESRDTTEGPFAWDGGQRGKSGGAGRKTNDGGNSRAPSSREADDGPRAERAFPMVRDRDLDRMKGGGGHGRSRRRDRSRSRSRSRSRGRGRGRSRSRSRDRRRRERQREGERERERQRQREREREYRDRERGRERERERGRDRERDRRNKTSTGSRDGEGRQRPEKKEGAGKAGGAPVTAEQAKAAVKRRLRHVVAADATLKTGATATVGGGMGWERPEMSAVSEYFQNDEVAAKGGVASVAVEYEARLAEILAVEDEDVMCLGDQKPAATAGTAGPSKLEQKHHDAIFAPAGAVSEPLPDDAPRAAAPKPRSVGGLGAAARARLALTGKLGEESTAAPKPTPTRAKKKTAKESERMSKSREDDDGDDNKPLFKTLRAGEAVEAQFTEDDKWYKAVILQVIHGGYSNAMYKVRYSEYGNEETVAWTRLKKNKSVGPPSALSKPAVEQKISPEQAEAPSPAEDAAAPPPFAGMRPRAMCVEKYAPPKAQATSEGGEGGDTAQAADVVNPAVLLSAAPPASGRRPSWKEKLAARKKSGGGAKGEGGGGGVGGVNVLQKKEISLVRDFAAQRREQAVDGKMDKSEWRTRVAFGIGNAKRPAS